MYRPSLARSSTGVLLSFCFSWASACGEDPPASQKTDGTSGALPPAVEVPATTGVALAGKPCAGFTVVGIPENDAGVDFDAFLVDMAGNTVHTWPITGFPPKMLPGGSLLGCSGVVQGSYDCESLRQVSFEGELEWSFNAFSTNAAGKPVARQHHDVQREGNPVGYFAPGLSALPAGQTLVLAHDRGRLAQLGGISVEDDVIYEVDWQGNLERIVFRGVEHFEELGFDAAAETDLRQRGRGGQFEWLHGNSISRLGPNPWHDAGNSAFEPNNILYSSRHANLVLILSADTGEVLWRIGPQFEGRPEQVLGQLVGQHAPHLIPEGLPGSGNLLLFDNGGSSGYGGAERDGNPNRNTRDYSRVVEFNPVTFEIIWEYGAAKGEEHFFSYYVSNAQRLPNGNTLITIGLESRVIEVTPDKQVVWEYHFTPVSSGANADWIYRTYRVPPEWLPDETLRSQYPAWGELFAALPSAEPEPR